MKACSTCGRRLSLCFCVKPRSPYKQIGYLRNRLALLADTHVCWVCGEPATPDDPLTADHVVEVAAGGDSSPGNLRAAHRSCNGRRGAMFRETQGS